MTKTTHKKINLHVVDYGTEDGARRWTLFADAFVCAVVLGREPCGCASAGVVMVLPCGNRECSVDLGDATDDEAAAYIAKVFAIAVAASVEPDEAVRMADDAALYRHHQPPAEA